MKKHKLKEGDIFYDGVLGYWIYIKHKGKFYLYPFEYYNNGKLNESGGHGCCSFFHKPSSWRNLDKVNIEGNYNDGFKPKPKGIFENMKKVFKKKSKA